MPVSTPAISMMPNGRCSRPLSPAAIRPDGDRPIRYGASSMRSSICCAPEPSGGCCRTSIHRAVPVFYHYAQWREDGTWEHVTQVLRESYRRTIGRNPQPTAAIIDSQSVKTSEMGGPRGYDGGKKVKGRKRHLLVDTQGNLLKNSVHPADIHDRAGAEILLEGLQHLFPAIELMWADTAYRGLKDWLSEGTGLEIVHPAALVDRRRLDAGRRRAADAPERLSGARTKMGGGADHRLAHHQPAAGQGL